MTPRLPQSKFEKTSKYASKVKTKKVQQDEFANVIMTSTRRPLQCRRSDPVALQGASSLKKRAKGYKQPLAPQIRLEIKILVFQELLGRFLGIFFSLFSPYFSLNKQINTSKLLDSSLFSKNTRQCSYPPSSSPWFHTLDSGLRGMDVAFQLLSIPLFLSSSIKLFILSFCLNNMTYCFLQHVFFFICASSLNLLTFYALCHVLCLDLHPYMLICLDLHVFMLYAMLSMLRSSLSYVYCQIHMLPCLIPCVCAQIYLSHVLFG